MMINKRLIHTVKESQRYIAGNVAVQWVSLVANIVSMLTIARFFQGIYESSLTRRFTFTAAAVAAVAIVIRSFCTRWSSRLAYRSSETVKSKLRQLIYRKLLRLGTSYREQIHTSEIVQIAVEGVDQLKPISQHTFLSSFTPCWRR